jgi:hypothetical protein
MLKIVAAGVTALCASILCTTPYSFRVTPEGSVSLSLDSAAAVIGRPLTPMSIAGVHRRAYRRAHYGAYYHPYRHYGYRYGTYQPYAYRYGAYRYAYGTYQPYTSNGGYGMWNNPWYNAYRPYRLFGYYRY